MPIISVIIPVYNVETYLSNCIESILNQTFREFEIILVNDGSPDNSDKICEDYAKKDSRIRIFHKENGGVSSARNLGIEKSLGKWLTFVDGDDFIEYDSFEKIFSTYLEIDSDIIIARSYKNNNGKLEECYPFDVNYKGMSFDGIKLNIDKGYMRGSACGAFYKKTFLTQHNISFPFFLKNSEDSIFLMICFINAKKIEFSDIHIYNVNEREGSATRSWTFERVKFMINNIRYLNEYINSHKNLSCEAKNIINFSIYSVISDIYNNFYKCFSLKEYFRLTREVRFELKGKINIGKIKICKNKVKLLNISLYLFSTLVLFKSFIRHQIK